MHEDELLIYQNPNCGKSRATLALIVERGFAPRVVEYLKAPPDRGELARILERLGIPAAGPVRHAEELYRTRYAGKQLTESQ